MRFVVKGEEDKTEKLASEETYFALMEIIRTGNKKLITDAIYRESYETPDGKGSRVEDQLAKAYKYKCAYCERICKADIEHYRPKKGVDEAVDHPGYYWLCYEWTNLLPSCITCNREGSKHNHFPILGERVCYPPLLPDNQLSLESCKANNSPLVDEKPYLLHPEVDHPEKYLAFEIDPNGEGIRLVGIDAEGRGDRTIRICLLNRKEVTLDRVERVIDEFKDAIQCLFVQLQEHELTEVEFREGIIHHLNLLKAKSLREDKTHTYLRKYILASVDNFEKIVLPFLEAKVRKIVLEAFKSERVEF
jgi:uncharacterized protein (TIGR02646 family)